MTLHDHTWYGHIVKGHPEVAQHKALVLAALTGPTEIRFSRSDADCRVYYGSGPRASTMVAVVADVVAGVVKTAYLARKPSPGGVEWS